MGIKMTIHNIKNIDDFQFEIPTEKGLYALTGENASGKSTVISCAASAFYVPSFNDYFGTPKEGAYIEFEFDGKKRTVCEKNGRWKNPSDFLGITGFYEGSIVFGNRFKDIEYNLLSKLSTVSKEGLNDASSFVKENLGIILHDNEEYYNKLYVLADDEAKKMRLKRKTYYYENKGTTISQLNMSTGENLLLTILASIERRIKKDNYGQNPAFMFLDEIELALHSAALRRLVFFLKEIADKYNTVVLFSTHSIELIRSIVPQRIFYLQNHVDGTLEIINPCYPVYATRNLESSHYGHDFIIMVEDDLAKEIVEKILRKERLLANKRILVISVGGWAQVIRFAYDSIRSNLALSTTKILIILDRDIKNSVNGFMKKENIGFSNKPNFLPIKSLEKYLLEKLVINVDPIIFRELNDYVFQGKSLDDIIKKYKKEQEHKKEKDKYGKILYSALEHELSQIRKNTKDLVEIIINYIFSSDNLEIEELVKFLKEEIEITN